MTMVTVVSTTIFLTRQGGPVEVRRDASRIRDVTNSVLVAIHFSSMILKLLEIVVEKWPWTRGSELTLECPGT